MNNDDTMTKIFEWTIYLGFAFLTGMVIWKILFE
jgi:hypothetical protein